MTTRLTRLMLCALLFLSILSCKKDSSKVDQNLIYQKYLIYYDSYSDVTTVTAIFTQENESGKKLELSGNSNVTINGELIKMDSGNYSYKKQGKLESVPIVFTDTEGKQYSNTVNLSNSISLDDKYYVEKTKNMNWYFDGESIDANETINLTITSKVKSSDDNYKFKTFSSTTAKSYHVTCKATDLYEYPDGEAEASISRVKSSNSGNFTNVGGEIVATYKGLTDIIYLY